MNRSEVLYYITLFTTAITIITIVGRMTKSVIIRLLMIQRKLDALKGLLLVVISFVDTINTYLVKYQGMGDRSSLKDLVQAFIDQYDKREDEF